MILESRSVSRSKRLAICAVTWIAIAQPVAAQELSPAQFKQLIVETIYVYEVREYQPPLQFTLDQAPAQLRPGSPEAVLVQRVRTMMLGDYEGFLRTWNTEAQKLMRERDRAAGRNASTWAETWKSLKGGTAVLVSRVDYGKYALLRYRVELPGGGTPLESSVAFAPAGDGWLGTHELIRDPVFNNWESGKSRVQTVAEIAIRK